VPAVPDGDAIEECIRGAQDGGVGVVIYCRKEGRALGEVTKFLVYNARKRQEGGDSGDNYFLRTECVAGVQDMRFQELMPDTLHWLGIRIHRLVSMSNLKYDAIVGSGIEVGERVKIPEDLIPDDARVEMDAKKAAGYFTDGRDPGRATPRAQTKGPARDGSGGRIPVDALLSTATIRERCGNIAAAVTAGRSRFFAIDRASLTKAAARAADVTRRRYPDLAIPYHSRWRHFEAGGLDRRGELERALSDRAPAERARAQIDLAVISVLLDAGAGPAWGYVEAESGQRFT
jgi:hypothetical protein